jgi:hypothetical protein
MRQTTAILTVCLCAVAGCRGGAAQEPYDGMLAAAQSPPKAAAIHVAPAAEAEPIASEIDVPWAIALLSDAAASATTKPGGATAANREPEAPEALAAEEIHVHAAVDPASAEEKRAAPKACSGVVKTRS